MIKIFTSVSGVFESACESFRGFKRSFYSDDDDEEYSDDVSMSSPPLKRGKFTDMNETELKVNCSGSLNTNRFSDGNNFSLTGSTRPYSSRDGSTPKGVERIIPIRMESSVSSNKENSADLNPSLTKSKEEYTPATSKYFGNSKFDNHHVEEHIKRPVDSFNFKPTLTSTAHKSDTSEVVSATKRKPLRSPILTPSKRSVLHPNSSKLDTVRRCSNVSRSRKKRNSILKPLGMYFTTKESFRLEEKYRYSQLLQQQTTSTVSSILARVSLPSCLYKGKDDTAVKSGAIVKTQLDPRLYLKSKKLLEKRESSPVRSPRQVPREIIITRDSSVAKKVPFVDLESEAETNKEIKLDDDLIIVKEIKPDSPKKNSLENEFQKSLCYNHDFLKELTDIYHDKKKLGDDDVEVMFETKKKCQETREKHEKEFLEKVEERISQLDIAYPTPYIEVTEDEEEKLPELTPEIEKVIERAFRGPPSQVLVEKFNIQITRRDIHTLAGLNWLNDEVINFYMNMLMERGKNDNFLSVYAFNTFFYSKLVKTGYSSVKRWTKKVDVFSYDLLIIPVHLGMHWCLATIDFRKKTIKYYDSMHGNNNTCLMELSNYLESEHQDKKKSDYDVRAFSVENVKDIPQQMNGSDCGMFSCKFAEYLSRDASITFTQEHMPYFRRRMVYEIVKQKLM